MSKPDPTGESLESILASIRKSLSEQSTGVLEEEAAPPAEAPKGSISGLARRLLAESEGAPSPLLVDEAPPLLEEDAAPVESLPAEPLPEIASLPQSPPPIVPPSAPEVPQASPPAAAPPSKDALWFLGRGRQAAAESAPPAHVDAPRPAEAVPQPQPSRSARPGVVRGPLPPFFGSSAEAQKAEVVLVQPSAPASGMLLPPAPQPANAASNGHAAPAVGLTSAAGPPPAVVQAEGLRNGAAASLFGHVASDARPTPGSAGPHTHALELMVAELLRPMLQRWLDENMPRLVATALKDEAVRMAVRDQNKV
jgi:uncharacterized protein